jgi:hypothetical protein
MNKKAASMWTIMVVAIVAIVLLFILLFAAREGTLNPVKWFRPYTSDVNIGPKISWCNTLCDAYRKREFCLEPGEEPIYFEDEDDPRNGERYTCEELRKMGETGFQDNCNVNIRCEETGLCETKWKGEWREVCYDGEFGERSGDIFAVGESASHPGEFCCITPKTCNGWNGEPRKTTCAEDEYELPSNWLSEPLTEGAGSCCVEK